MQQNHLVDLISISPSCLSTFAQPGLGGSAQPGAGTSPKWTLPAAGPQAIVEPDIAAHLLFPLRARVLDGRAYRERADALGGRRLRPRPFGPPGFWVAGVALVHPSISGNWVPAVGAGERVRGRLRAAPCQPSTPDPRPPRRS